MSTSLPPGVRDESRRTITSDLLGSTMTWTNYSHETSGAYTEVTAVIKPGYANPAHYHTLFKEIFTCTNGTLTVTLDGKKHELTPSSDEKTTATVEIGHYHSLINASSSTVEFTTRLEPGNEGFEKAMYIMHGLANDGLSTSEGIPKSIVHASLLMGLMDTWLEGWGWRVATPVLGVLRRYGKGMGEEARLVGKYWS